MYSLLTFVNIETIRALILIFNTAVDILITRVIDVFNKINEIPSQHRKRINNNSFVNLKLPLLSINNLNRPSTVTSTILSSLSNWSSVANLSCQKNIHQNSEKPLTTLHFHKNVARTQQNSPQIIMTLFTASKLSLDLFFLPTTSPGAVIVLLKNAICNSSIIY